jgi:hypothetical protein
MTQSQGQGLELAKASWVCSAKQDTKEVSKNTFLYNFKLAFLNI